MPLFIVYNNNYNNTIIKSTMSCSIYSTNTVIRLANDRGIIHSTQQCQNTQINVCTITAHNICNHGDSNKRMATAVLV